MLRNRWGGLAIGKHLYLERAKGYGNAQDESTSVVLGWREVFDSWMWNCYVDVNATMKVLLLIQPGEPHST